jgi:glc operon protein GlcG
MPSKDLSATIVAILDNIETFVPGYMAIEEDRVKANGSIAACVIDEAGNVYGRIVGDDKVLGRERYRVAWTKASQVWITGIRTGEFEKLAFTNQIDERKFGIRRPDYIGWEGGQPVTLKDGTVLSIGVSGFRSVSDLEIAVKAIAMLK